MASGTASAPVVWRRGRAVVSGRLIASDVTGHTCRPRLAGAPTDRHDSGRWRRGSGIVVVPGSPGRGDARNTVNVTTEEARGAVVGAVRR